MKHSSAPLLAVLIILVAGFIKPAADPFDWKIAPDPTIVNFDISNAEVVTQDLVAPPFLPVHEQVATTPPRVVNIRLEIVEREVEIAPGVFVWQMAFNNSVPGPVPVVFQWDWVHLTLVNGTDETVDFRTTEAGNQLPHNIDFHASTGALGGGGLTTIGPGQEVGLRRKAEKENARITPLPVLRLTRFAADFTQVDNTSQDNRANRTSHCP